MKPDSKIAYSVEEASELTSLSKSFLRKEIRAGRLRASYAGRRVVIMHVELCTYLEAGQKTADQPEIESENPSNRAR